MTINIPLTELTEIGKLSVDGENPNRMTEKQLERLKTSIEKYGFIVPIITNNKYLVADGEQRLTVAKSLGYTHVPVVKLDVEDVDRRLLRQVLNKLRGEHDLIADALEFEKIIGMDGEDELKHLLDLSDQKLKKYLSMLKNDGDEQQLIVQALYEVVVECEDEKEQEETYNKLKKEGYKCRVLIL